MLTTPHILTGITIANKIQSLPLALAASMVSHQMLDLIPHDDFVDIEDLSFFKDGHFRITPSIIFVAVDSLVAFSLLLYFSLYFNEPLRYLLCGILSIWSDLLRIPYIFFNSNANFFKTIDKMENNIFHNTEKSLWGKAIQIAIIIDALAIITNAIL
jgi:hypothetical protein